MKAAFQNYSRARRSGEWFDQSAVPQHLHEGLMDALRGCVREWFPEGRAFGRGCGTSMPMD